MNSEIDSTPSILSQPEMTVDALRSDDFRELQINKFQDEIYTLVKTGLTFLESIAHYCAERDMEPEEVVPFISDKLRADITDEALQTNQLKKQHRPNQLDFD